VGRGRDGGVLLLVMGVLAALGIVGGTLFVVTRTDLQITANYKRGIEAFQHADAGVQYAKNLVNQDLQNGTILLLTPTETVNYTPPNGYDFDPITQLTQTGNTNAYVFQVVGHSGDSEGTVEAVVHRRPLTEYGVFGDLQVDLKAFANIYSYDSRRVTNPGPGDSTSNADTASNEEYITNMGTLIDGSLVLGEDAAGNPATWKSTGTPNITGYEGDEIDRIEPDPLGAVGGDLAAEFTAVKASNDNGSASPAISGNKINLSAGDTMTLPAGDYYLTDVILRNGATLDIDASAGPVNLYLEGKLEAKNGSAINSNGQPTDFNLFSNSNKDIIIKNNGGFKGYIYAPNAFVEIMNSGDFFGVVWGEEVEMKNTGDIYVDMALLERYWSDSVYLVSWKEVRR
jgi:hypothetical protein